MECTASNHEANLGHSIARSPAGRAVSPRGLCCVQQRLPKPLLDVSVHPRMAVSRAARFTNALYKSGGARFTKAEGAPVGGGGTVVDDDRLPEAKPSQHLPAPAPRAARVTEPGGGHRGQERRGTRGSLRPRTKAEGRFTELAHKEEGVAPPRGPAQGRGRLACTTAACCCRGTCAPAGGARVSRHGPASAHEGKTGPPRGCLWAHRRNVWAFPERSTTSACRRPARADHPPPSRPARRARAGKACVD